MAKVIFLIDHISFHEVFSIPLLSAIAKKDGHYVRLVEFRPNPQKAFREISSFSPDIIAYSICSNEAQRYLEINHLLKKEFNFFSLFGGPHPTFNPSFIEKDGVDGICRGEGDISFLEFLRYFGSERMYEVGNFSFNIDNKDLRENPIADLIKDLDTIPFPDRDLLYKKNYFLSRIPIKTFMSGRGCPYKCTYCFNHVYNAMYRGKGKILRTKSVTYLFNEIKDVAGKYPLTFVKFHDDIFGANIEWLREFSDRYPKEIGLPFNCYVRPNMVREEYCRLLKRGGCYSVSMAIECGNEHLRNNILQRNMSNDQIYSACEILKKYNIRVLTLSMIGLPGETEEDIFATIKMNQRVGIDYADVSIFQPYPGTRITEYCKKNGYLNDDSERYESQFTESILNIEPELKCRIYVLHKLFAILVDYPKMESILTFVYRAKRLSFLLEYIYRLYFGFFLHRRIFGSVTPFFIKIYGGLLLIFAKNRGN